MRVVSIKLENVNLDVLLIEPDDEAIPYRLEKDYSGKPGHKDSDKSKKRIVRAGTIYSRDGDGNTPINSTANTVFSENFGGDILDLIGHHYSELLYYLLDLLIGK